MGHKTEVADDENVIFGVSTNAIRKKLGAEGLCGVGGRSHFTQTVRGADVEQSTK